MDAWLREAEEASRWVEDLENKLIHNNLNFTLHSARSILFDIAIKLDRLESLLRNPPIKPILEFTEHVKTWISVGRCFPISSYEPKLWLYLFMHYHAQAVFALLLLFRPGNVPDAGSKEYNVTNDYNDQDLLKTTCSQGQSELAKQPLLSEDANTTQIQLCSFMPRILPSKACSTILFFLGLVALLFVVILLLATT